MYYRPTSLRLKDSIKQVGSPVLDALGVFNRSIERVRADASVWTILMYHRVTRDASDDPFGLGMCVRLPHFEEQIAYLQRHFNVLPVDEVAQRLARAEPLPPATLSITFDDGYLDNLLLAQPVLERYGLPWSLYVTTGGLEDTRPFWWDRTIRAVAATHAERLDLDGLPESFGGGSLSLAGSSRRATVEHLLETLWALPIARTLVCVQAIEERLLRGVSDGEGPQAPRMSPSQLNDLAGRPGVSIGAHTVRHPNLNLLPADEVAWEMRASRQALENLLQRPVPGFVYPGGRMNAEVVELARAAGFRYALSTESHLNLLPADLLCLGRVGMPDANVADFRRSLHSLAQRVLNRHAHSHGSGA
jgi:peptidoglycan/xylan/chitin deacetylase (PgdA/CDA1 family)